MTPNCARIVISNPCSEDWNSMSVDTTGRFCQSCQKSVIDFTSKTDEEIKNFLKGKQGERLCGRFYINQVERIHIEIDPNLLVSGIPFWQKFLVVLLICFSSDFPGCNFVLAQTQTDSIDSIPVQTALVDSLAPTTLLELDSTPEITVDSFHYTPSIQKIRMESIAINYPMIVMGGFTPVDSRDYQTDRIPFPFLKSDLENDSSINKKGIAHAENIPVVPKRRKKKPVLPENAIIADSGERRKTRRS